MELLRAIDGSVRQRAPSLPRRRFLGMGGAVAGGFALLAGRLFQLQVLRGDEHRGQADGNRLRTASVPAQRGLIYDRNRLPMLRNRPSYTIGLMPADLPRNPDPVFRRLAKLAGGSASDYRRAAIKGAAAPFSHVQLRVTPDAALAQALEERSAELPGVLVEASPSREYMDGVMTSHLLGHVGPITEEQLGKAGGENGPYRPSDRVGQGGVEAQLEEVLRGTPGTRQFEVDATGREVTTLALDPPKPGANVVLSIDLAFQREVHRIVGAKIAEYESTSVVCVDPSNGQILAMVHQPAYDNQLFADGIGQDDFAKLLADPLRPLLNGAIASAWPPGSTFKLITALGALEAGVVTPDTRIHCSGGIRLPGGTYLKCWAAHGEQDMISALAVSCDSYFYQLAGGEPSGKWQGLGPDRLADWSKQVGLGQPSGVALPGEVAGIVPTPTWKKANVGEAWYAGDTYISGIGQGFYTATPVQMAMLAATFANGGTLYRPQIQLKEPEVVRKLAVDDKHVRVVRDGVRAGMMIDASPNGIKFYGTSWDSNIKGFTLAGKTGTAEYGTPGPDGKLPTHGWFIFWAPHENPRLAGAVFVKHGRGSQEAAKLGSQVVRSYFGIV